MNTIKKKRITSIALVLLLGWMLFVNPVNKVHAQTLADEPLPPVIESLPEEPPPVGKENDRDPLGVLERLFKQTRTAHSNQQKLITYADRLGNRISELIARAKENGKDTTVLEQALADFNIKIGEVRLKYDQTGKLIKQHSGFDDAGKVTDAMTAENTLEQIHSRSKEVRQSLGEALRGLREAVRAFREANPKPADSQTSNPA